MKSNFSHSHSGPPFRGNKNKNRHRINDDIRVPEVRIINPEGKMLGIFNRNKALKMAEEFEMDLVEISPNAKPPVCKIIDYGKFQYELQKKEKQQRKNQQQQQMKEIRFKWRTATHDFNFKTRHAKEFIKDGNKVKGTVMFRGREITHHEIGKELLKKFIEELEDIAKIDQPLKFEGRNLTVVMAPDKAKAKKK